MPKRVEPKARRQWYQMRPYERVSTAIELALVSMSICLQRDMTHVLLAGLPVYLQGNN